MTVAWRKFQPKRPFPKSLKFRLSGFLQGRPGVRSCCSCSKTSAPRSKPASPPRRRRCRRRLLVARVTNVRCHHTQRLEAMDPGRTREARVDLPTGRHRGRRVSQLCKQHVGKTCPGTPARGIGRRRDSLNSRNYPAVRAAAPGVPDLDFACNRPLGYDHVTCACDHP